MLWANLNEAFGAPFWYDTLYGAVTPAGFREWLWPVSGRATTLDGALAWTQAWLIHGHFYTLLGFLFGIGFAVQPGRAERRGDNVRTMFYRRVLVLLAFGLVNGTLIFSGDVLTSYALVALFLPFYARVARAPIAGRSRSHVPAPAVRSAKNFRPSALSICQPLTTYLMQCIVITLLFYGYGLGWYGQVGLSGMLVITLVLFPLQMAFSVYWLQRFRFGPAEWLWRSLSYGSAQPMRVAPRLYSLST